GNRSAQRHGHAAHAGNAPGDGQRRSGRRRPRRGPHGAPPRGAHRRTPRQGQRALLPERDDGQPGRALAARPPRHRGAARRQRPRAPLGGGRRGGALRAPAAPRRGRGRGDARW
ncbi:MAG: Low-specificity L-threonine aldolase, partial [uncultured Gemmatimonadaceae bacterium]